MLTKKEGLKLNSMQSCIRIHCLTAIQKNVARIPNFLNSKFKRVCVVKVNDKSRITKDKLFPKLGLGSFYRHLLI